MNSQDRLSGTRLAKYHQPSWWLLLSEIGADIRQNTERRRGLEVEVHHRIRSTAQLIEKHRLSASNRLREEIGESD